MRLELEELRCLPGQQLVGQALERLAQHDEPAATVASAEMEIRQHPDPPTVPPLGCEHDEIEGVPRLHLHPTGAAATRFIRRLQRLDHHALVAVVDRVGEESRRLDLVAGYDPAAPAASPARCRRARA